LLARCALAAVLASLFVWVGAQHVRTDITHDAAPTLQVAANLDTPTVERGSASLSLDAPSGDPLFEVLRRVCTLLDRVPPVLRAGFGTDTCG
jgi:hypothetical protein